MSSDTEMEDLNTSSPVTVPSAPSASAPDPLPSKRSTRDYSLPPSFVNLLTRLVQDVIDELLPLPDDHRVPTAHSPPQPALKPIPQHTPPAPGVAFVGAFQKAADALTENGGHAHTSTQSALVDLFFDMAPPAQPEHLRELLDKAFREDPVATVRLIFQTRSIHEGKGFKEGFWVAAGWLAEKHPRTLLANLHILVDQTCKRDRSKARDAQKADLPPSGVATLDEDGEVERNLGELPEYAPRPHGTYDDLIDLLVLDINGELNAKLKEVPSAVDEAFAPTSAKQSFKANRLQRKAGQRGQMDRRGYGTVAKAARKHPEAAFKVKMASCSNKETKHKLLFERLEKALTTDVHFQALYCVVVDIFVRQLKADLALLDKHKEFLKQPAEARKPFLGQSSPFLFSMTYAAKWVPSPEKSADRQLSFATALGMLLFPGDGVQLGRQRLQKEVLAPLRAVLKVPEVNMGKGEWKIDYTKVPSRAMARYSHWFLQHDHKGFESYLNKVATGRLSISGASLFPHEILMDVLEPQDAILGRMAALQWVSHVDSSRSSGSAELRNCLAIADVSGSMGSYLTGDTKDPQPINVCIALTLLLGELAAPPWSGLFFTFSDDPAAVYVDPSLPLKDRASTLSRANWGCTTNFYKVFDLILTTAKTQHLAPVDMVKKLFIFSDMQFSACTERKDGETEYAAIKRKYIDAGYTVPELIFWNLAPRVTGAPKPVQADQEGVSLLSGYSGSMMKYFLGEAAREEDEELAKEMDKDWEAVDVEDEDEEMTGGGEAVEDDAAELAKKGKGMPKKKDDPLTTVRKILAAESYKGVVVVD